MPADSGLPKLFVILHFLEKSNTWTDVTIVSKMPTIIRKENKILGQKGNRPGDCTTGDSTKMSNVSHVWIGCLK